MVSAFPAFHVGQMLQNQISLGHDLWLASLCQPPFHNWSWKWLWTVCMTCTSDAWTNVACWSMLDVWRVIRAISHAVKHVAAIQHYLNQPGCLILQWKFAERCSSLVLIQLKWSSLEEQWSCCLVLFPFLRSSSSKHQGFFWVDPTYCSATWARGGGGTGEGGVRMGQSLLVAACRSSESFSISGNPRPASCGCSGAWWKQSLSFQLWCLHLLSFQLRCFNLQNAMLGFRCAQLEFFPRHRTAEIAEFACGFQCSDQSVFIGVINFPREQGWSRVFYM